MGDIRLASEFANYVSAFMYDKLSNPDLVVPYENNPEFDDLCQADIRKAKDGIKYYSDLNCSLGPRHPHGEDEKGEIAGNLFRKEWAFWKRLGKLKIELEVTRYHRKWGK